MLLNNLNRKFKEFVYRLLLYIKNKTLKYGSERYGMVWDMGCRYYTAVWYGIKTIPLDFYGMIWEIYWYHPMVWEISGICRGISCCMQGYGKYTIYRNMFLYMEF